MGTSISRSEIIYWVEEFATDMTIHQIIKQLHASGAIPQELSAFKPLEGGTSSQVYGLYDDEAAPRYIIKINAPAVIENESIYLKQYAGSELLPRIVHVDPAFSYAVYTFIPGSTQYVRGSKSQMLKVLVEKLINKSKPFHSQQRVGYLDDSTPTWTEFLLTSAHESRGIIGSVLGEEDYELMRVLTERKQEPTVCALLHGDCGVHNFVFDDRQLVGVIDPYPVVGEPIYDLIFAYCSSPDQLDEETILAALGVFDPGLIGAYDLNAEVLLGLYSRIATCIMHHPSDLDEYIRAWNDWKKRVLK